MKVTTQSSRARGQALLFAVLLMVFAALLGATFVTVVSMNLNQTDRSVARTDAVTAAQAGMKYLNDQLVTDSSDGEAWRPESIAPPPDVNDASYNEYYTPFERAQGWALSYQYVGTNLTPEQKWAQLKAWKQLDPVSKFAQGGRIFVKIPDPRSKETSGPVSLVEVTYAMPDDGNDKKGMLRLTAIGRSEDNDTAFARLVSYKRTALASGPLSFARYDANYDVTNSKPLIGRGAIASDRLTIAIPSAPMFAPGNMVAIVQGGTTQFRIIAAATTASGVTTIILKTAVTAAIAVGSIEVRAASAMADGLESAAFDSDGGGVLTATDKLTELPTRDATKTSGLFFNNGLYLAQKVGLTVGTTGRLSVSGSVDTDGFTADQTINTTPVSTAGATLVSKSVVPLAPPALDNRFSRYRRLTAETTTDPSGIYGYGLGVYIDNREDIEKVGTTELKNWELQRLWQRKPFNGNSLFYPADLSSTAFPGSGSLEQSGARGWISPWQFLPRGTFIELAGDDIILTRDDRFDAAANPDNDPQKCWTDATGVRQKGIFRMRINISTGQRYLGREGAETLVATVPFNGVIFTEGNVRVRGYLLNKNIIIASLGTIYVEGNILRDTNNPTNPPDTAPRIALIAKRNVVVNPTMFVGLPNNWRDSHINVELNLIALNPSAATTSQITATTTDGTKRLSHMFRIGDAVRVAGQATVVTALDETTGLTVSPAIVAPTSPVADAIPAGSTINLINVDPPVVSGKSPAMTALTETTATTPSGTYTYETNERFYQLTGAGATFAREARFDRPAGASFGGPLWLNYLHGAQMRRAFTLKRFTGIIGKTATVKKPTTSPTILDTDKLLDLDGDGSFDLRDVDTTSGPDGDGAETIEKLLAANVHFPVKDGLNVTNWDVSESASTLNPTEVKTVAARRLAYTSKSMILGSYMPVALTTARRMDWGNDAASLANTAAPEWFGGAPSSAPAESESNVAGLGVNEEFYWRRPLVELLSSPRTQSLVRTTSRPLSFRLAADGVTVTESDPPNGWRNPFSFTMDAPNDLPGYRIVGPRLSNTNFPTAVAGFTPIDISVQATILVRDGSFFVLPAPAMASSKIDADNNGTQETSVDLNGDNAVNSADTAAATVYRRLNYHLEIRGNIAQNIAPTASDDFDALPDADGKAVGATRQWLDSASYPRLASGATPLKDSGNFAGGVGAYSWDTVSYVGDGFTIESLDFLSALPVTPDLLYVG